MKKNYYVGQRNGRRQKKKGGRGGKDGWRGAIEFVG